MNTHTSPSGPAGHAVTITRVEQGEWHAVEDGLVVGRGYASARPDGRLFIAVDAWQDAVFDRLAGALLADLPRPVRAVVDEAELDATSAWERVGFAPHRREWHYQVPTDPQATGLDAAPPPSGVQIVPLGAAREEPLHTLDHQVRAEVAAGLGWAAMPVEILPRPAGVTVVDPTRYVAAEQDGRYVGLARIMTRPRYARVGLVAVLAEQQRRGIARALLGQVLGALHRDGFETAAAEVDAANAPAIALFEGLGAQRVGSYLELVRR